jgi:hypothetical protein
MNPIDPSSHAGPPLPSPSAVHESQANPAPNDATHGGPIPPPQRRGFDIYELGGIASIGAAAVHAVAVGSHAEHPDAAKAFVAIAVAQLVAGVGVLISRRIPIALLSLGVNGAAIIGWVLAKTSGISAIRGLDTAEPAQTADLIAVALAVIALVAACTRLISVVGPTSRRFSWGASLAALALIAVTVPAMVTAGTHTHGTTVTANGSHDHTTTSHDHSAAGGSAAPTPYDPTLPIDLSGVEGVTPEQQAKAENLIAVTLAELPQFADPAVAEAQGFRSIQDGFTGYEHYINWSYIGDDHILDPAYPESLVYQTGGSQKKLVSAMFMLPQGSTLDTVPDLGGKLTQWHIHNDLCFDAVTDPSAPRVAGVTRSGGTCRPPTTALTPVPMIHVWIVSHPCGPFAALEGVGAGQVKAGETKLCDHVHGA